MNWDQIEQNWVAMTRRVRPERPTTDKRGADLHPSGDMAETASDLPEQAANAVWSAARLIA